MGSAETEDSGHRSGGVGLSITGRILIPGIVPGFHGATAHIFLEELKGEDAAARVIAETTIHDVSHESAGGAETNVSFTIRIAPGEVLMDAKNDYAVRVWIDCDSDGKRAAGDLYSDQRHNVFTGASEGAVNIKLVRR
jgi:hypothetical protein